MFDVTAVADALEAAIEDADQDVREQSKVGGAEQIAEADEINDETIAFARDGLERQEQIAQKQVDLLKEKNAAVVNLQQKIVAYNNVAEEINETATDYAAEASKFGIANGLDVDAITLANADAAGAFQVSVKLGAEKGSVAISVENGKAVVTGFATAEGAADLVEAKDDLAQAEAAAEAAQSDYDTALDKEQKQQAAFDALDGFDVDTYFDGDDAPTEAQADALAATLKDLIEKLEAAEVDAAGIKALLTTEGGFDGSKDKGAVTTAIAGVSVIVESVDDTDLNTKKADVVTKKEALAEAEKAGGDEAVVEEFNKLKGVDALKAQIEALHANIAKEEAAEKAIGVAALKALEEAGYKVFNDKDKVVAWSNVKVEEGKIVSAKDGKEFTVALEKDGKPDLAASIGADAALFDTGSIGAKDGELNAIEADLFAKLGAGQPPAIVSAAESSANAVTALDKAQKAIKAFDEAVEAYNTAKELQADLKQATDDVTAADKAVIEAEEAFADLGAVLIVAEEGVAKGAVFDEDDEEQLADLFVFSETLTKVEAFDGDDEFYFGQDKGYSFKQVDAAKNIKVSADASVFEIFAVQEGANTVLYVEKEAFAGNSSVAPATNTDLVKVELVGVNAEDLQFNDGFLTFA